MHNIATKLKIRYFCTLQYDSDVLPRQNRISTRGTETGWQRRSTGTVHIECEAGNLAECIKNVMHNS